LTPIKARFRKRGETGPSTGAKPMVGLVLSPEQVKSAPPEIRAWLHAMLEAEVSG
jgi:hypothetical protein